MLAWIKKWHLSVDRALAFTSAGLILFLMALGTVDVLCRYLLNAPIPASYEIMKFTMGGVAFFAFAEAGVEAAVLEVGLGGRLDATNAVDPTVAVITSISYDHTQILGETLPLIAREKAGIIRPGALVISAPQLDEAMQMIEEVCISRRARLVMWSVPWN